MLQPQYHLMCSNRVITENIQLPRITRILLISRQQMPTVTLRILILVLANLLVCSLSNTSFTFIDIVFKLCTWVCFCPNHRFVDFFALSAGLSLFLHYSGLCLVICCVASLWCFIFVAGPPFFTIFWYFTFVYSEDTRSLSVCVLMSSVTQ